MPLDTVRTRKQVISEMDRRTPVWHIFKNVYENEGITGFWKGVGARMTQNAITAACMLTCYELIKRLSVDHHVDDDDGDFSASSGT